MSWTCSKCGKTEADDIECVMNFAAKTYRHLHACADENSLTGGDAPRQKEVAKLLHDAQENVKEIVDAESKRHEMDPTIYNQGLRESAEKSRRGIEVLEKKTEQHGAKVCTISGLPPDPDYDKLHAAPQPVKSNGQHADYYVLCPEERAKGFVRPVRQEYVHDKCHTKTWMGLALSETYARDPHFYGKTFCCACQNHFPVAEFKWLDGEVLGT